GNDIGLTTAEGNQQSTVEINRDTSTSQGNYPPSPVINNLIIKASLEEVGENRVRSYKSTARKYPTINYEAIKEIPTIQ
ncbi:15177_t:CDS:1, partial [Racocetra fulgida]